MAVLDPKLFTVLELFLQHGSSLCIDLFKNKTPAQAFTPAAEKKIGTKWALCTTAQAGNIKSGYLRILSYIGVVLCLVIGQLHVLDKCVYHEMCR